MRSVDAVDLMSLFQVKSWQVLLQKLHDHRVNEINAMKVVSAYLKVKPDSRGKS